jgi:ADP-ribose pyrophosphatase YjhB (NUDIX family)
MKKTKKNIKKSYGIVLFRRTDPITFLLVRRKDTHSYIDFLRGNYDDNNMLQNMFDTMTRTERDNIKNKAFDEMWKELWKYQPAPKGNNSFFREQKRKAKHKYELGEWKLILSRCDPSIYTNPDWGFPKGRPNRYKKERPKECALREFEEETGYSQNDAVISNGMGFSEVNHGTDGKIYKNIYFPAELKNHTQEVPIIDKDFQAGEISGIGWFTYNEALQVIRPYHTGKLQILKDVHQFAWPSYVSDDEDEDDDEDTSYSNSE